MEDWKQKIRDKENREKPDVQNNIIINVNGGNNIINGFVLNQDLVGIETKVKKENLKNGINIDLIRKRVFDASLTMLDISKLLNITLSDYSDYKTERKAMPLEVYEKFKKELGI